MTTAARRRGLATCPLDEFRIRPDPHARPALVLGYGNLLDNAIDDAVRVLAEAIAAA